MNERRDHVERAESVDVLVITAVKDEYDAVLQVDAGALSGSTWDVQPGPTGLDVAFRTFLAADGGTLRFAVTRALEMGGVATANAAVPLVHAYKPRCVAMCGVCAGRRGEVELGDVIIADRLWTYDLGKIKVETTADGRTVRRVLGDTTTYQLDPLWKQKAESFTPDPTSPWLAQRPRSFEAQTNWVLDCIMAGANPAEHPDSWAKIEDYSKLLERLWKEGLLQDGSLNLTEKGRKHIERLKLLYPRGLPEPKPFQVHVGPIGTGTKVVQDPGIFDELSETMRKVLGLEMEASAIGSIAHLHNIPHMIVMKGVMDFADSHKGDNFKPFAARASAECLIAFIRANLSSNRPQARLLVKPKATEPKFKDILDTGISKPPTNPSPAAILNARYEFVPFVEQGRSTLLKELREWCDSEEPVSARLFHGVGGVGKTRLFIEWCKRLLAEGWAAGFLAKEVDTARFEELLSSESSTLIVIDYAESRSRLNTLLQLIARRRNTEHRGRLRLVLLARAVGDWWQELLSSEGLLKDLLSDHLPMQAAPIVATGTDREAMFREAARSFAALRGCAPPEQMPALDDPRFERALYIHMAALAMVDGRLVTAERLMEDVLDHEERFWTTMLQPAAQSDIERRLFTERARRVVTALTLTGGAPSRRKTEMLVSRIIGAQEDALILLLHDLYPSEGQGEARAYVNGLEPDLLGEAMVLRTLRKEKDAASDFLERVFRAESEQAVRNGFEVLGRLSVHFPEEVGDWLAVLFEQDIDGRAVAALEAAKAIGQQTAHAVLGLRLAAALKQKGTGDLAARLEAAGLPEDTVSLREVAVWVMETLLRNAPNKASQRQLLERARLLNDLGARQSALGRWEAALASTQKAVSIWRELAKTNLELVLPDLAMSLSNEGSWQRELGRWSAALAPLEEAVTLHRQLAEKYSEKFLPNLATSLSNLGAVYSDANKREAALQATQEAVVHFRNLAEKHPEAFQRRLALSLANLSKVQHRLGQRAAALKSAQEAVVTYRKLADRNSDAFLPDLALSLNNLGTVQSDSGLREDALKSTQESVEIRRKLTAARPDVFLPELAKSLNNLTSRQNDLGLRQEAWESAWEAVTHYRKLAEVQPDTFLHLLAGSLINFSNRQSVMGQSEPALESAREAVTIFRKQSDAQLGASLSDLAHALMTLGIRYAALEQWTAGLEATQESIRLYRQAANNHPEAFLLNLASSLTNLVVMQSELKQYDQAMGSAKEAVALHRKLVQKEPRAFIPNLAMSLNNLGSLQRELGMMREALESIQEGLDIIWPFFVALPDAFSYETGMLLENLFNYSQDAGSATSERLNKQAQEFRRLVKSKEPPSSA